MKHLCAKEAAIVDTGVQHAVINAMFPRVKCDTVNCLHIKCVPTVYHLITEMIRRKSSADSHRYICI